MIIHNVEQNSDEWHVLRAGMPTASSFSMLVSGTGKLSESLTEYARQLGIEVYKGFASSEFGSNYHTRRGHELEPHAVAEYEFTHGVEAQKVGFVTDDEKTYGSSPDRLIGQDGVLEIKCLSDKEHYLTLEYYDKTGDIKPKYKPQLQGELLVCERVWNDIVFYHPDMPTLTHRVVPDSSYIELLQGQIKRVLSERDRVAAFLRGFNSLPPAANEAAPKSKLVMNI